MTPSPIIVSRGKNINVRDRNGKVQPRKLCEVCGESLICLGETRRKCLACYRAHFSGEARKQSVARIFDGIPCRSIPLTQGYVAWVDEGRFDDVARWKWTAKVAPHTIYASRRLSASERQQTGKTAITMHRYLKDPPDGIHIDHRDGDGLHNWDANLRFCTQAQNSRNQKKKANVTGHRGVRFDRKTGKYVAQIGHAGKHYQLGSYRTAEEAGEAYRQRAKEPHGDFAPGV